MPNLPGSTPSKDLAMCKKIFTNPNFQPDQIKLYPCVVAKGSLLYRWWKQGKWKSYSTKTLINLLINIKSITPPWVRIIRVIRDIPEESIIDGNKITNLRQTVQSIMREREIVCQCIRCREAGHQNHAEKYKPYPQSRTYKTIDGTEIFLSFESKNKEVLFAFCRLCLPKNSNTALIRELHTYGQMTALGQKGTVQHRGMGKKLLQTAEKITKQKKYTALSIISGIGVRDYYRKLGYQLQNTYMLKKLK